MADELTILRVKVKHLQSFVDRMALCQDHYDKLALGTGQCALCTAETVALQRFRVERDEL